MMRPEQGRISAIDLSAQKILYLDPGLSEDRAERAFRDVSGMIRKCGVAFGLRVVPEFMAARGLTVEFETQLLQALRDITVAKAAEPPHPQ